MAYQGSDALSVELWGRALIRSRVGQDGELAVQAAASTIETIPVALGTLGTGSPDCQQCTRDTRLSIWDGMCQFAGPTGALAGDCSLRSLQILQWFMG